MATSELQTNTPTSTWARQAYIASRAQMSIRFQVDTPGFLNAVAWYQVNAGDVRPTKIGFYGGGVILWSEVAVIEDVGVPGWQWMEVPVKIQLNVGTTYAVSIDTPNPGGSTYGNPADRFAPPDPFLWDDGMSHTQTSLIPNYPPTLRTDQTIGLNVRWEDVSHVDNAPPLGSTNAQEALLDWLDPTAATKPDEDPGLYPRAIQALESQLGDGTGPTVVEMGISLADITGLVGNVLTAIEFVRTLIDVAGSGANSTTRTAGGTTAISLLEALALAAVEQAAFLNDMDDKLDAILLQLSPMLFGVSDFPTGWLMVDETTWEENIAWAVPAQVYVVTVTDYAPGTTRRPVGDIVWMPRIGWWSPLNGTQAAERAYLEFETQQLHDHRRVMPGVLLVGQPGSAGTIQAWVAP